MNHLNLQLQPNLCGADAGAFVEAITSIVRGHSMLNETDVTTGIDDDPYVNVDIKTADLNSLWPLLRATITNDAQFSASVIATCAGDHGWDDYQLLHHFDTNEPIDPWPADS